MLKNKYDQIIIKEDQMSNLKIESSQLVSSIKVLSEKKENLVTRDLPEIISTIKNLKLKAENLEQKKNKHVKTKLHITRNLKEQNIRKDMINKKINDL